MKRKTLHIKGILDCQVRVHGEGFNIEILADNKNGRRIQYVLHFKGAWWVRPLTELLWKVISYEQDEVDKMKYSITTNPKEKN